MANFYVSETEISERHQLLLDLANELIKGGTLPESTVIFRSDRLEFASHSYWLLNSAYKAWRIPDGHYTEKPKIAALQAITIARFQPFFPIHTPVETKNITAIRCNEIFALCYALGILEVSFVPDTPEKVDLWLRILDVISSAKLLQTLEPYYQDINLKIQRPLHEYQSSIKFVHEDDWSAINSLICIFELISSKREKLGFE